MPKKDDKRDKQLTIRCSQSWKDRFEEAASREECSLTDLLMRVSEEWLARHHHDLAKPFRKVEE